MFFELREYALQPGKREEWVKWMDEEIIPFQVGKGMVVTGSFVDVENDRYFWMRRFESEEERDRLYKAVYESDWWINEAKDRVGTMIDRTQTRVSIVQATPRSVLR